MDALHSLDPDRSYNNRDEFKHDLDKVLEERDLKISNPIYKAILAALSERDPTAEICADGKGRPEPDPQLRDTETVALPAKAPLPLPIRYKSAQGKEPNNDDLVDFVRGYCDGYFARELKPHWPDLWIDYSKTKVGYEIPINRHFYVYEPPRPLEAIETDIEALEAEIVGMLKRIVA